MSLFWIFESLQMATPATILSMNGKKATRFKSWVHYICQNLVFKRSMPPDAMSEPRQVKEYIESKKAIPPISLLNMPLYCRKIQLSQCGIRAGEAELDSLQSLLFPFNGSSCSFLDRILDSHWFSVCWVQSQVGNWVCFGDICPDGMFVWIRISKPGRGLQYRNWRVEGIP